MIINEETYRLLLPTFTAEQLEIINSNKEETLKEEISVRTLSLNEWNKYIINDTLNGSITAKNINTWHYSNAGNIYNNWVPNQNMGNHNMYYELSNNNTSNTSTCRYISSLNFYLRAEVASYQYKHSYDTPATISIEKNKNIYSYYFGAYSGITSETPWLGHYKVQYIISFRPVFEYIDNRKSSDIYK